MNKIIVCRTCSVHSIFVFLVKVTTNEKISCPVCLSFVKKNLHLPENGRKWNEPDKCLVKMIVKIHMTSKKVLDPLCHTGESTFNRLHK